MKKFGDIYTDWYEPPSTIKNIIVIVLAALWFLPPTILLAIKWFGG